MNIPEAADHTGALAHEIVAAIAHGEEIGVAPVPLNRRHLWNTKKRALRVDILATLSVLSALSLAVLNGCILL